jgi:sugar phosphate isomerase/epimerase
MKFGISNLSWNLENDSLVRKSLTNYDYIETIFSRINYGYYSTQSIFYGTDIKTFDDVDSTLNRLNFVIEECNKYSVKIIVLGSPSLRKGNKNNLLDVFKKIDDKLKNYNIFLCVEPNSSYYGGEYYFTLSEIVNDICELSNVKTMIDTHNLLLENQNIFEDYKKYSSYIKHCHFSEKELNPIQDYCFYNGLVDFFYSLGYDGGITYELKSTVDIIEKSKQFIRLKKEKQIG